MRLFWVDANWAYVAEAVASNAALTLRLNDVGAGSVKVVETPPSDARGLVAVLDDGTEIWRGRIISLRGDTARDTLTVRLLDMVGLLGGYLAWPEPGGDFAAQEYDTYTGPATSAIMHYIDANAGPSALAWRQMGITLAADPGLGATVKTSARFDNLLTLCREIATLGGVRLRFSGTECVADVGVTHSDIVFAEHAGTVERIIWEIAAPAASAVLAGGAGQGTARILMPRFSPGDLVRWGVHEQFWDVRNVDNASDLATLAGQWLAARESGYAANITPSIPVCADILPGDIIRVWTDGAERSMVVQVVTYTLTGWAIDAAERVGVRGPTVVDLGLDGLKRSVELLSTG